VTSEDRLDKAAGVIDRHIRDKDGGPRIKGRDGQRSSWPRFIANSIQQSIDQSFDCYHLGKEDRKRLKAMRQSLLKFREAYEEASPFVRQSLSACFYLMSTEDGQGSWTDEFICLHDAASDPVAEFVEVWIEATSFAFGAMKAGKSKGQNNWEALTIIGSMAQLWERQNNLFDRKLPQKELTEGHPFEAFLDELFDAFGINASARNQFRTWRKLKNAGLADP